MSLQPTDSFIDGNQEFQGRSNRVIKSVKENFVNCLDARDKQFGNLFAQTQIFQFFCEEVRDRNLECNQYYI